MALSLDAVGTMPAGDAPAIRAVDEIFELAISSRASDIHIEPLDDGGRVRQRVDGILQEIRRLPEQLYPRVLSRVKLLAGMDIADRRQPQDGRYVMETPGRRVDARVSSMPTISGERLVVRLLDSRTSIPTLTCLGMDPLVAKNYERILHAPSGFVVISGPTGSGKTTTAYASISQRNVVGQHLCSVEDPVEVRIPGTAQVQINPRTGLTFASVLRGFLRQDPNVIMIGEMRDAETAAIAVAGALSGSLVITTLHSPDAIGVIERLADLGLPPKRVAAAVSAIVGQRLLRKLCADCKVRVGVSETLGDAPSPYRAGGCERCGGTGYRGRCAAFELMPVGDELRDAIASQLPSGDIRRIVDRLGLANIRDSAAALVASGETSIDEYYRVISPLSA